MGKRGRPKGSKNKIRRGRPLGSKNKKRRGRGRPKGSRNKLNTTKSDFKVRQVGLTCINCNRYYKIRTDNPELYTPEIKKKWVCPICKRNK